MDSQRDNLMKELLVSKMFVCLIIACDEDVPMISSGELKPEICEGWAESEEPLWSLTLFNKDVFVSDAVAAMFEGVLYLHLPINQLTLEEFQARRKNSQIGCPLCGSNRSDCRTTNRV